MKSTLPKFKNGFFITIILISFTIFFNQVNAQPGSLDPTFGIDGKVILKLGNDVSILDNVIQADGKILLAGYLKQGKPHGLILRFKTTGVLDSSFGDNGQVIMDDAYNWGGIAIQKDRKIIVAGESSNFEFLVARYDENGNIDNSFGMAGMTSSLFGGSSAQALDVKILGDGKILTSGAEINQKVARYFDIFLVAKLNIDGRFDSSFGEQGHVFTIFSKDANAGAFSIATNSVGDIYAGGGAFFLRDGTTYEDSYFALAKYKTDGSLNSSFADSGKLARDKNYTIVNGMILTNKGKILMAGESISPSGNFELVQYKSNGVKDSAFGNNGIVLTDLDGEDIPGLKAIAQDKSDRIIVGGHSQRASNTVFAIVRYNANGTIDETFGDNGKVSLDIGATDGQITSLSLQKDGKILISGYISDGTTQNIMLARYLADATLPVKLLSFTGSMQKNVGVLNWQTSLETHNAYFSIERSANSVDFVNIGKIEGDGNSTLIQNYRFIDTHPEKGVNYYRLKQVDKDGYFAYSDVIALELENNGKHGIFPNPVKDIFTVDNLENSTTLTLCDSYGKILLNVISSSKTYSANIKNFAAGVYYLHIKEGNKMTTLKIIKQ